MASASTIATKAIDNVPTTDLTLRPTPTPEEAAEDVRRELVVGYVPFVYEYLKRNGCGLSSTGYYVKASENDMTLRTMTMLHKMDPQAYAPPPPKLSATLENKDGDALRYWVERGTLSELAKALNDGLLLDEKKNTNKIERHHHLFNAINIVVHLCRKRLMTHFNLTEHPSTDYTLGQYLMCDFSNYTTPPSLPFPSLP